MQAAIEIRRMMSFSIQSIYHVYHVMDWRNERHGELFQSGRAAGRESAIARSDVSLLQWSRLPDRPPLS
jgi:hypothetical protein